MRQQRVFHLACRFLIAFYGMLFPTNHLKIIDFKGKIVEIAVFLGFKQLGVQWLKTSHFGGSGEALGRFREAPGGSREAPGRLRGGSGRLQVALGEPRRLRGGSRRLRGGSRRLPGRSWRLQERPEGGEPLGGVWSGGLQTPSLLAIFKEQPRTQCTEHRTQP